MTREEKQKALYALKKSAPVMAMTPNEFADYIKTLNKMADWLEQEPCEDCISRQALVERINNAEENFKHDNIESISSGDEDPFVDGVLSGVFNIRQMVTQAPPVTLQPKTGHWIEEDVFDGDVAYRCSECNALFLFESGTPKDIEYNFCPKCGAKMVEPQESEE